MKSINYHRTPEIDEVLYEAFFGIQNAVEKSGIMDYQIYAQKLWEALGLSINDPEFQNFKTTLISNMKAIDMKPLLENSILTPDILDQLLSLPCQISAYSTGDVHSTGYQISKYESAGIKWKIARSMKRQGLTGKGSMRNKFSVIIDERKAEALAKFLEQIPEPQRPKKIVLIDDRLFKYGEDEVSTLKDIRQALKQAHIACEVVPVWYTNARMGMTLKANDPAQFEIASRKLNGIESLESLTDQSFQEQLGGIDEQTLLLVDGDGVTWDNVEMREQQINAKIDAIIAHTYLSSPELIAAVLSD